MVNEGRFRSSQTGLSVKQMASAFGGANPSLPTFVLLTIADVAQLVEHLHGKE